ncbi:hypothetical protein AVV29_gp025 [Vibrio phage phi 3]|uniref:Uncharacterized protein n=1 Tax=Vibrio phage phi 3 TaxID=1589298 RepID=A0A0B5H8R4_9CAUD|nr:hypothetical protein AVV29_gp025 [Vibrio phage phi 3]AJF40793.1 hypothetical protein SBVP3_0025 [Vibrio phage phi 3]
MYRLQIDAYIKEYAPGYRIESGHYLCHPETCTCDNWVLVKLLPHGRTERITSSDSYRFLVTELWDLRPELKQALLAKWPDFLSRDIY